ncbi:MAG: 6,7-dimethyl-8-ribityllumazine synthase [Phycisphaeraceae bacterium]|nr:6,7-dimethyl-8-ribityllumazine synthase [Phycisphaeraceae bacterium]
MTQPRTYEGNWNVEGIRPAIVVARFNSLLTEHMLDAAVAAYRRIGGDPAELTVVHVPGSFEFTATALKLAESAQFDVIICLGVVIRGETDHYDHVCEQTARGVREVSQSTGVPCIFGVVTADTVEQAVNRCGVKLGNQGEKALLAGIEMARLFKKLPVTPGTPRK